MNTHSLAQSIPARLVALLTLLVAGLLLSAASMGQVPVDENGNPIAAIEETGVAGTGSDLQPSPEPLSATELEALVGPIALYPDELLAIVLPASTYPLEIVQAARFLEAFEEDKSLQPDDAWDESITALLNYPEVVELMNDDIDWTWQLGEAVVSQQSDVIAAVEAFRDRAYAAGNLKTDDRQVVKNNDGIIEISPANEEIIYVPYYEPERVVVYQPRPAYYYYPRPYPVYYYPYPHGYNFYSNYFWGVTTAYAIGWNTHHLHVFHHSYWGHPYYGRSYYGNWYRRPSITVYNTWYGNRRSEVTRDHYRDGDFWRPRHTGGARPGLQRSRVETYRDRRQTSTSDGYRDRAQIAQSNDRVVNRTAAQGNADSVGRVNNTTGRAATNQRQRSGAGLADNSANPTRDTPIRFRERAAADTQRIRENAAAVQVDRRGANSATVNRPSQTDEAIRFRQRERQPAATSTVERARQGVSGTARTVSPAARPQVEQRQAQPATRTPPRTAVPRSSVPRSSAPRSSAPRISTPRAAPSPAASQPRSAPARAAPRPAPRVSAPRATAAPKATSRATPARPATRNDSPKRNRDR
ncbi:MAG: DUF3300 domain-containing protein [Woeseia sp.]